MLQLLERRLDNVVFRSQFALTRPMARQLVSHGHITVNGKKVTIPSFQVREGDVVALREKSKNLVAVQQALDVAEHPVPDWVDVEIDDRKTTVRQLPSRDQIDPQSQEQPIVELYSK